MRHDNRDSLFLSRTSSPEAWTAALPGPRLACCDPAYFSLEIPDPVCRSASPLPWAVSQARVKSLAGRVASLETYRRKPAAMVRVPVAFECGSPGKWVKWRCSALTPILPPGAAVPAWLHSSLSVTLSPPVSGSRGRVISENGYWGCWFCTS